MSVYQFKLNPVGARRTLGSSRSPLSRLSPAAHPIYDHASAIYLAENMTGWNPYIRFQYPALQQTKTFIDHSDEWIAQRMIPENIRERPEDTTIFLLNHIREHEKIEPIEIEAFVYHVDPQTKQWQLIDESMHETAGFQLVLSAFGDEVHDKNDLSRPVAHLSVRNQHGQYVEKIAEYDIPADWMYTVLDENYYETGRKYVSFSVIDGGLLALVLTPTDEHIFRAFVDRFSRSDHRPFLYGMSFVRTYKNQAGELRHKAIAILSQHAYFYAFKSLLRTAMEQLLARNDSSSSDRAKDLVRGLFDTINSIKIDLPAMSELEKRVWRWSIMDTDAIKHLTTVEYAGKPHVLEIPLALTDDEIGDERTSINKLVTKFRENTMMLYSAIVEERRIIFFQAASEPASDLCFAVASACLLAGTSALAGLLKRRVFPLVTTTYYVEEVMHVPGYICGTTDPNVINKDRWDVVCRLDTGEVMTNRATYGTVLPNERLNALDKKFIEEILRSLNSHALNGLKSMVSEEIMRSNFREYTKRFVDMALGEAVFENEQSKAMSLEMNKTRIENWKKTESYQRFLVVRKGWQQQQRRSRVVDPKRLVGMLKTRKDLTEQELVDIFQKLLDQVQTEPEILELLWYLPETEGGLYPIASVLLNPVARVRHLALNLLKRIEATDVGICCVSLLNGFLLMTFDRLRNQEEQKAVAPPPPQKRTTPATPVEHEHMPRAHSFQLPKMFKKELPQAPSGLTRHTSMMVSGQRNQNTKP